MGERQTVMEYGSLLVNRVWIGCPTKLDHIHVREREICMGVLDLWAMIIFMQIRKERNQNGEFRKGKGRSCVWERRRGRGRERERLKMVSFDKGRIDDGRESPRIVLTFDRLYFPSVLSLFLCSFPSFLFRIACFCFLHTAKQGRRL